jgi:hypothetical protein
LVSRSLLALVRCPSVEWRHGASRSSQTSRSGGRFRVPVQSSAELRLLQSMTFVGGRAHRSCMLRDASLEVLAPPALSNCRVHLRSVSATRPGFASPGTFRPQGFSPSRRLSPRTVCPALFHAGALLEFLALQSFSLVRSRNASRRPPCLPACWLPQTATRHAALGKWPFPCEQVTDPSTACLASRLCSPERVRCETASGEADDLPDALLGFGPLQGRCSRSRAGVLPHRLLPRAFRRRRVSAAAEATAPVYF